MTRVLTILLSSAALFLCAESAVAQSAVYSVVAYKTQCPSTNTSSYASIWMSGEGRPVANCVCLCDGRMIFHEMQAQDSISSNAPKAAGDCAKDTLPSDMQGIRDQWLELAIQYEPLQNQQTPQAKIVRAKLIEILGQIREAWRVKKTVR